MRRVPATTVHNLIASAAGGGDIGIPPHKGFSILEELHSDIMVQHIIDLFYPGKMIGITFCITVSVPKIE